MLNHYTTYKEIEAQAALPAGTASVAVLETFIEGASRIIDKHCKRHFYIHPHAKNFDGISGTRMKVPDLIAVSAFAVDTERDLSFDGETWTENTDFYLAGLSRIEQYPKRYICLAPSATKSFVEGDNLYRITAQWGYGNETSSPWQDLTPTGTVADATGTTLTLSGATTELYTGNTIIVESEQMYVSSYAGTGTSVTVVRGVNNTTAASHSAKKVSKALYPEKVVQCCMDIVIESFFKRPFLDGQFRYSEGPIAFVPREEIYWRQLRMLNDLVVREVC